MPGKCRITSRKYFVAKWSVAFSEKHIKFILRIFVTAKFIVSFSELDFIFN